MRVLEVDHIGRTGRDGFSLQDISFVQDKGQQIALAGETGSGKTTLLKIIAGLEQPDTGEVRFQGVKVVGPLDKLIPGHPSIAYLSQHFELRNNYRVEEILSYANKLADSNADRLFHLCRIRHLMKRKTDQLSGGEKQRIALARLLIGSPKLLVLDEPFSNLDPGHKQVLKAVLQEISQELDISCILSSHDPADSLSWADQILVLQQGRVIQQADPHTIYHHPVNEYAGALFGAYSLLGPSHPAGKRIFTRPESFRIVEAGTAELQGKIRAVHFMGGYYAVEVDLPDQQLLVHTCSGNYAVGMAVSLEWDQSALWYV